jgi:hypothetical protein
MAMILGIRVAALASPGKRLRASIAAFALTVVTCPASSQEATLAELLAELPRQLAAEVETRLSTVNRSSASEGDRVAALDELKSRVPRTEAAYVRAEGGATASARCSAGHVLSGDYRASAQDVEVSERRVDCDGMRCRAFQVNAKREGLEPFELEVSVSCSR